MIDLTSWFHRGNRVRDKNGLDICFMSCDPVYQLNDAEKKAARMIALTPDMYGFIKNFHDKTDPIIIGEKTHSFLASIIERVEG